jgi:hypothetical protein
MSGPVMIALILAQADSAPTLVSALVGLAGVLTGAIGTYLARRYRIRSEAALTEQQQLFGQYRRLVAELRGQVGRLGREVRAVQQHYLDCRLENASLRARAVELEKHIVRLGGRPEHGTGDHSDTTGGARPQGSGAA